MILKRSQKLSQVLHRGAERATFVEVVNLVLDGEIVRSTRRVSFGGESGVAKADWNAGIVYFFTAVFA